jgi:hypothetical protein
VISIKDLQQFIGAAPDGVWGPKSQALLDAILKPTAAATGVTGKASSFADPADIRAFDRCKAIGGSDQDCFKVGDNGVGCWGDNTKEGSGPCCAVPGSRMVEKWGSRDAAKHKMIRVTINGKSVEMPVKDRQSEHLASGAVIDLNPDAGALFGLRPPFLVSCSWQWV